MRKKERADCVKKHVWILNHYAGGMYVDKGGRHYNFAKYLKQAGYEPAVFCAVSKHGKPEPYFEMGGLWEERTAEAIGVPWVFVRARTYTGNGKQRVLNMLDFYRNVKKAAKEYAEKHGKPDIIYASSVHPLTLLAGIQLAKRFGVKCVCEVRDLWPESLVAYGLLKRGSLAAAALYAGEKWLYKKADAVIMTWPGGYDYIRERGWERQIPAGKVVHISNGVDLTVFAENRESRQIADADLDDRNKFHAVYAGSVRKVNDLRLLVDAAEILARRGNDRVRVLVWGDGDQREALESLAREKGLENIRFKGRVEKNAIPYILSRADVTILHNRRSKLDKYGQSQNKFFEYLAAGKPILMTYSVGYSVCRARNCGIELEEQTPEAVADALEQLSGLSEDDYQTYAKNAAAAAEEYDFRNLTQKLIGALEAL